MNKKNDFNLIFIVGTSRSGTTMLNRVLNNNSNVTGMNELHYFNDIVEINDDTKYTLEKASVIGAKLISRIKHNLWNKINIEIYIEESRNILDKSILISYSIFDIFYLILASYSKQNNTVFISEQTPKNIFYIKKLIMEYPNIKIIHMVRDPRGVLLSQKNRWKKKWLGAKEMSLYNVLRVYFNYHPITLLKLWNHSIESGKKLEHEKEKYIRVKFEDLVTKPEGKINEICHFLGLKFENNMLNVPQVGSSNMQHTHSKVGISSEVKDKWVDSLSNSEKYISEYIAEKNMYFLGYTVQKKSIDIGVLLILIIFPFKVIGSLLVNPKVLTRTIKAIWRVK